MNALGMNKQQQHPLSVPPSSASHSPASNSRSIHDDRNESAVVASLRRSLAEREQALNEVRSRLQELHGHYSELHAAYQLVSRSVENAAPREFASQIGQLQTALAVAIDDKTNLQTQLRVSSSRVAALEEENASLQVQKATGRENLKNAHTPAIQKLRDTVTKSSSRNDSELRHLSEEKTQLLKSVASQSAQLEQHRRECSRMEAQILVIQQDRNEAQARLKHLYDEKCRVESEREELRNELQMKELYIKQLTRHSQEHQPDEDQKLIQRLIAERNEAGAEAELRRSELTEAKKQLNAMHTHCEALVGEVNARVAKLQAETTELKASKAELQSAKSYLEEQLRLMRLHVEAGMVGEKRAENEGGGGGGRENNSSGSSHSAEEAILEFNAMKNSYDVLEEEYQRCVGHNRKLEEILNAKEERIVLLHNQLTECQRKLDSLEEANSLQDSINTEAAHLSQQLQNEKATVSRAVAQNVELKDQLAELQEKLVKVINESAEKETERVTAICEARELRRQIEEMKANASDASEKGNGEPIHPNAAAATPPPIVESEGSALSCGAAETTVIDHTPLSIVSAIDDKLEGSVEVVAETSPPPARTNEEVAVTKELESRLQEALKANKQFNLSNQQLQYWLTALETENESIGEYVALYRFQRGNVQKKLTEREEMLKRALASNQQLTAQLNELQQAVTEFASRSGGVIVSQPTSSSSSSSTIHEVYKPQQSIDEAVEETVNEISEQRSIALPSISRGELAGLLSLIERQRHTPPTKVLSASASHLSACSGQPHQNGGANIECSGCVECRGEILEL